MKTYEVKYQRGTNIYIAKIKATRMTEARYLFYMKFGARCDILNIEEVKK